jgi:hypothetical protein
MSRDVPNIFTPNLRQFFIYGLKLTEQQEGQLARPHSNKNNGGDINGDITAPPPIRVEIRGEFNSASSR